MKIVLTLLLISSVYSGNYRYNNSTNEFYDRGSNKLYIEVKRKVEKGFIKKSTSVGYSASNFLVYDIAKKTKVMVFPKDDSRNVSAIYFESYYDKDKKQIIINKSDDFFLKTKIINSHIPERDCKDKLLFEVYNDNQKNNEIWESNKTGKELKKLFSYYENDDWHIDLGNSKVRLIRQLGSKIKIEEFPW